MAFNIDNMDGTSYANYKAVAETIALVANRMNQDMAQNQAETSKLGIASLAQQLERANALDPAEAASIHGVVNSTLAQKMDELIAALGTGQVVTKLAQSTPPETGGQQ